MWSRGRQRRETSELSDSSTRCTDSCSTELNMGCELPIVGYTSINIKKLKTNLEKENAKGNPNKEKPIDFQRPNNLLTLTKSLMLTKERSLETVLYYAIENLLSSLNKFYHEEVRTPNASKCEDEVDFISNTLDPILLMIL
ncbi:hypothetical protein L2E82_39120 [Cichorium intybus]|uniref:Uncharacterized protein n=1 Tax=Cichorium intybus TaxID=13427 RepID=A0ACB9ALQ9_CICIN|nr:hypothetical protein L2E82_39120 [Cichorium intybus]